MPDIAMCANKKCPGRLGCHRFVAVPAETQAYGDFFMDKNGFCYHHIPAHEGESDNYLKREQELMEKRR